MTEVPGLTHAQRLVLNEALSGETPLWVGRPAPGKQWVAFVIWLFAIPWTAFSLFWESMALMPWFGGHPRDDNAPLAFAIIFPLFGLPFIAIGFWMLAMPIRAMLAAKRTIFAVTEKRIVKVVIGSKVEVKSLRRETLGEIERTTSADGSGTIRIVTGSHIDSEGDRVTDKFEMIGVPDVAGFERIVLMPPTKSR